MCSRRCRRSRATGAGSFAIPVVGLTGSNGKTTVKEMIGSILREHRAGARDAGQPQQSHRRAAHAVRGSRPLHRYAVIEMGANHQREIAHLAGLAEPTIGLVNNAGPAHLEGFGGLDGVAQGKGELFESLGGRRHRRDQRRRPLRATCGAGSPAAPAAYSRSGCASRPISTRLEPELADRATAASRRRFSMIDAAGRARRSSFTWPASTTCSTRSAPAAAAYAAGADLDAIEQGLALDASGLRDGSSSRPRCTARA